MKLSSFILLLSLVFISCAKKESSPEKAHKDLTQINTDTSITPPNETTGQIVDSIPDTISANLDNTQKFIQKICKSFDNSQINTQYDDDIFTSEAKDYWNKYEAIFETNHFTCSAQEVKLDTYPNTTIHMNFGVSLFSIYLTVKLNDKGLIESFHLLPTYRDIVLKKEMVKVDNNVSLATYSMFIKNKKAPVIFLKTPYLALSFTNFTRMAEKYNALGFSFVAQSNRGTYESQGSFKWLHKQDINDQKVTLKWISQQEFYQDGIIARGTSYAGYNALTASVTNSPYLKAVIACSAPANAKTDSFTANEITELGHLTYLNLVKKGFRFNEQEKVYKAIAEGKPLASLDNIFIGQDEEEWEDILNSDHPNSTYYQDRNLLPLLKNTKVPTLIAGGFNNDQDGADSILAYKAVHQNENIGGYFHQHGHGCGVLDTEVFYTNLLKNTLANTEITPMTKLILKYANTEYKSDSAEFPMETLNLDLDAIEVIQNPNEGIGSNFVPDSIYAQTNTDRTFFIAQTPTQTQLEIFGQMNLKISFKNYSPYNAINVAILYLKEDGTFGSLSKLLDSPFRTRTQILLKEANSITTNIITSSPVVATIPAGSRIVIELSSNNITNYPFRKIMRSNYVLSSNDKMGASIIGLPKISIPKQLN
jgi:hypothetical protein